jgi:hypothetical protein
MLFTYDDQRADQFSATKQPKPYLVCPHQDWKYAYYFNRRGLSDLAVAN